LHTLLCLLTVIRTDEERKEATKFRSKNLWHAITLVSTQPRGLFQKLGNLALMLCGLTWWEDHWLCPVILWGSHPQSSTY
jgi:hypothetical protein